MSELFGAGGGRPDEVVRILWINEFIDNAKGLAGATRKASAEYRKAASEQRKLDQVGIASAKKAADAARDRQEQDRNRLRRFQQLIHAEKDLIRERDQALADSEKLQDQLARREEKRQGELENIERMFDARRERARERSEKRLAEITAKSEAREEKAAEKRDKAIERAEERFAKKRLASEQAHNKDTEDIKVKEVVLRQKRQEMDNAAARKIQERVDARELQEFRNQASARKKVRDRENTDERNAAVAAAKDVFEEVSKEEKRARSRAATDSKRALDTENREFKLQQDKKVAILRDSTTKYVESTRARIKALEEEHGVTQESLDDLEELRGTLGHLESTLARFRGRSAGEGINLGFRQMHKDELLAERDLGRFRAHLQKVREEAIDTGRVSPGTWDGFVNAVKKARVSNDEFQDSTRRAGIEIRNFENAKTRELRVLRENTTQIGRHNRAQRVAVGGWKAIKQAAFLSTNEMILFSRTVQLLAIPALTAFAGVAVQALGAVGGAAVALASGLGPLVGVFGAIPAAIFSGAQAFGVLKLSMDNLGKSSNNLSKVISVSLTGLTDDFNKMVGQLPEFAKRFAVVLRTQVTPGFDVLRQQIQESIFGALTRAVQRIVPAFRPLRSVIVDTGTVFQQLIDTLSSEFTRPRWVKDIGDQMRVTNMRFRELIPDLVLIARGFRDIMRASDPLVDHLVELTDRFSKWFAGIAASGRQSGGLQRFFMATNEALDQTLSLLGGVAKTLINIGKIAYQVLGRQMLKDLADGAQGLAEWTESPHGMKAIAKFFTDIRPAVYEFGRLIRDLVKSLLDVSDEPAFFQLLKQVRTEVLPAFSDAMKVASQEFAPAFIDFLTSFAKALAAVGREGGGLTQLVNAFKFVADVIRIFAQSPLGPVFFKLLAGVAILRTIRFGAAVTGLASMTKIAVALAAALSRAVFGATALNRALASTPVVGRVVQRAIPSVVTNVGTETRPTLRGAFAEGGVGGAVALLRQERAERRAMNRLTGTAGRAASTSRQVPGAAARAAGVPIGPIGGPLVAPTPFLRGRGFQQIGRAAGVLGIGALGASAIGVGGGGTFGNILGAAGAGAGVGTFFGPGWGTAIGAAVGALGGLAISLRRGKDATESFAEAAQRTARALGQLRAGRERTTAEFPQARLDLQRARLDFRQAQGVRERLQRAGVGGVRLEQAQVDERQALRNLSQAARKVAELRLQVEAFNRAITTSSQNASQNIFATIEETRKVFDVIPQDSKAGQKELDGLIKKLRGIAASTDDIKTDKAVAGIIRLIEKMHELPDSKTIQIFLQTILGPATTANERESGTNRGVPVTELGLDAQGIKNLGLNGRQLRQLGFTNEQIKGAGIALPKPAPRRPRPTDFQSVANAAGEAADTASRRASQLQTQFQQSLALRSIDANSIAGIKATASFEQGPLRAALNDRLSKLNRQLVASVKAGEDKSTIKTIRDAISQTQSDIAQIAADAVTHVNDILKLESENLQRKSDQIAQRLDFRRGRLAANLERKNIDPDSVRGLRIQNIFDKRVVLPGLRQQVATMRQAIAKAVSAHADPATLQGLNQVLDQLLADIAQVPVDIISRQRAMIRARRERKENVIAFNVGKQQARFERLQLRQRIAGTFDTQAGAAERKAFVEKNLIPELRRELKVERTPVKGETLEEKWERIAKANETQNSILELIAQATEETAKNTIPQITGQLAFGFGGQITTDVMAGQVGA